jgi:GH35 family endo-1,4-beta-xylanase
MILIRKYLCVSLPLFFIPLFPLFSLHAKGASLPDAGISLLQGDTVSSFRLEAAPSIVAPLEVVSVEGEPFQQALRIRTLANTETPYEAQLYGINATAIHSGDVIFVTFYLRSAESKAKAGSGFTELAIEQGGPDYKKLVTIASSTTPEWKKISLHFTATTNTMGALEIPAGKARILFRLGYGPQTIEIGGVEILNFGPTPRSADLPESNISYIGHEPDAIWRKEAEERIEKIRKEDLSITVSNPLGEPISGAVISVKMQRHTFGFGSAVNAQMILLQNPEGEKYRNTILKYFNKTVIDNALKWGAWEQNRQPAIDAVKWLRAHHIAVRGHNLVWPSWSYTPDHLRSLKNHPEALSQRIDEHITDEVTAMKGQCVEWDVINELYANHDLTDLLGQKAILRWFQLAHQADPEAKLFMNDYDTVELGREHNAHANAYEETIKFLLDHGAPLSGIGIQSHFGWYLSAPVDVLKGLDRFAKLGLQLEITEHDININDEQLQADYTRDYMILAFSHPAVTSFISWGFWEGCHWAPDGAYFRKDWSLKPAGKVWIDLVTNQWWTNATGITDTNGLFKTRGFLGDYEICVTHNGRSTIVHTTLNKNATLLKVLLN